MPHYHNLIHSKLEERILQYIETNGLTAHSRLPSERTLAETFGVSRMTVRAAIKHLCNEGSLQSTGGSGTYLRPARHVIDISPKRKSADHREPHDSHSVRITNRGIQNIPSSLAWEVGWDIASEIYVVKRIRHEASAIAYDAFFFPTSAFPGIQEEKDEAFYNVTSFLHARAHKIRKASNAISFTAATSEQSGALGLPKDAWIIEERRKVFSRRGEILLYCVLSMPMWAIQYTLDICQERTV
jgi:GntR family transcriptional regulator